jgi:hypothetical protein
MYTILYDAITTAIHEVNPDIQFVGTSWFLYLSLCLHLPPTLPRLSECEALALGQAGPEYYEYFLNHQNHDPKAPWPPAYISYHWYAHFVF